MNYKHLSQNERYQIYAFLRAGQTQSKIASILGRHKSTISRELKLGTGLCNYHPKQACALAAKRAKSSRNASQIAPWVLSMAMHMLEFQFNPEQIAGKLPISHETLYLRIYAGLNYRPRKRLGFKIPHEVFHQSLNRVALRD